MATGQGRRTETPTRRLARRVALGVAVVAVIAFAVEGGQYGTSDLLQRTSRRETLELEVARLQAVVDSLQEQIRLVETDAATLERIAREEFGMVKGDRELLYRFAEDLDDGEETDSVAPR